MNRRARRMRKQLEQGRPTTGRPGCVPGLLAALATWLRSGVDNTPRRGSN